MPDFRKVISLGGLWELPPSTLQYKATGSNLESFVRLVVRPLWGFRLEIAMALAALVGVRTIGEVATGVVIVAGGVASWRWPVLRKGLRWALHRARVRRQWGLAVRHAKLVTHNDRIPRPVRIEAVPAGEQMRVKIPAGSSVTALADQAERIAAFLRVREVRVVREANDAGRAAVTVVRRDPLAGGEPLAWPNLGAQRLWFVEPIPLGVDEAGEPVTVSMLGRNMIVGGEPGGGKSVLLSMLVATAALDPSVRLTLLDGKLVELAVWSRCADATAGTDIAEAIEVLRGLQADMDGRYRFLLDRGLRKLSPSGEMPLRVVACDLCRGRNYAEHDGALSSLGVAAQAIRATATDQRSA